MPTIDAVNAKFDGDSSGFVAAAKAAEASLASLAREAATMQGPASAFSSSTSSMASAVGELSGALAGVTLALSAFVAGIAVAGATSVKAASDLEQTGSLLDRIFDGRAADVRDFARSMSADLGTSLEETMRGLAGLGAQLKNTLGDPAAAEEQSKALVKLAADLSAAMNIPFAESIERLQSGLRGETESIEKLNIFIGESALKQAALAQGISKSVEKMNEQEKVQLRLSEIFRQTADLTGAAKSEAETFAGQMARLDGEMKNLAVDIGKQLLPAATDLIGVVRDLVKSFSDLSPGTKDFLIFAAETVAVAAGLAAALTAIGAAVAGVTVAVIALDVALAPVLAAVAAFAAANAAWLVPLAAAGAALGAFLAVADDAPAKVKPIHKAFLSVGESARIFAEDMRLLDETLGEIGVDVEAERLAAAAEQQSEAWKKAGAPLADTNEALNFMARKQEEAAKAAKEHTAALEKQREAAIALRNVLAAGGSGALASVQKIQEEAAARNLDIVQGSFGAGDLESSNEIARKAFASLLESVSADEFGAVLDSVREAAANLGISMESITEGLADVTDDQLKQMLRELDAQKSAADELVKSQQDAAKKIKDASDKAATAFVQGIVGLLSAFSSGGGFAALFSQGGAALGGAVLASTGLPPEAGAAIGAAVGEKAGTILDDTIGRFTTPLFDRLGEKFDKAFGPITEIMASLADAASPLFDAFEMGARVLAEFIGDFRPEIEKVASAFADVLEAIIPFSQVLLRVLGVMVKFAGGDLEGALDALAHLGDNLAKTNEQLRDEQKAEARAAANDARDRQRAQAQDDLQARMRNRLRDLIDASDGASRSLDALAGGIVNGVSDFKVAAARFRAADAVSVGGAIPGAVLAGSGVGTLPSISIGVANFYGVEDVATFEEQLLRRSNLAAIRRGGTIPPGFDYGGRFEGVR